MTRQPENRARVTDLTGRKRDLVEWLREEERGNPGTDVSFGLLGLAAEEIEKLRKVVEAARQAMFVTVPGPQLEALHKALREYDGE